MEIGHVIFAFAHLLLQTWTLGVARLGKEAPIGLLLAAVGSLKFDFGALLLFGLLLESFTTTLATSSGFLMDAFFVLLV